MVYGFKQVTVTIWAILGYENISSVLPLFMVVLPKETYQFTLS